jgi:TQXA domain-containing protein
MLFLILNLTSFATIQDDIYHLSEGVEYLDKTFVYEVINTANGNKVLALCAEKEAPTYDAKKGLMTWVDYKSYNLEEIFTDKASKQVRSIIFEVGPHRGKAVVVNEMKETTGLDELTYEEIVSAMQYAIWFYTDGI